MDDSSVKGKTAIPEWQKTYTEASKANNPAAQPRQDGAAAQTETKLVEDAQRFLAEDSVRNASRERKVAFLEKKGLQGDDIQKLLGPGNDQPSSAAKEDVPEMKIVHDSTTMPTSQEQPVESPMAPVAEPLKGSHTTPTRDIPPIITYPEFLLKAQKPPPLVTFQRLAYAAYALAGLSTVTYGVSKFIVQPMLEALTEARRDLAESTLSDLEKLNSKLEANVSHIPVITGSMLLKSKINEDLEDVESIDSDPTELFHRDVATQTSPQRSRTSSLSSSINLAGSHKPKDTTTQQASLLASLHTTLGSLNSFTSTSHAAESLKEGMSEFQTLLDSIQNSNNPYQSDYPSIYPSMADDKKKKKPGGSSEAAKFKAEIRALKGALLGARQFPVARPAAGYAAGGVGAR